MAYLTGSKHSLADGNQQFCFGVKSLSMLCLITYTYMHICRITYTYMHIYVGLAEPVAEIYFF